MSLSLEQVAKVAYEAYASVLKEQDHQDVPISWEGLTKEIQVVWVNKARQTSELTAPDINDSIFEDDIIKAAEHIFMNVTLTLVRGFLARIL